MIEFPDVSHYQDGLSLTGVYAAVAKCTQGTGYFDPSYDRFRRQAAALRIPFSGYHWLDTADPAAQARWYHQNAADAPCMWDAEAPGATVPRILAATAELKAAGGHAWGAYLPHWWWQGHINSPDLRPLAAAGLVLVSSDYRTTPPGTGWAAYGGVAPTVWQYTDKQVLNGVPCDFNRFDGTVAELATLFSGATAPAKEDDMKVYRATPSGAVWVSNGPQRWHVPDPQTYHDMLKLWGLTEADVIPIADSQAPALGQDVALTGAGGGGAVPPTTAQIATAVNDEAARRLLG